MPSDDRVSRTATTMAAVLPTTQTATVVASGVTPRRSTAVTLVAREGQEKRSSCQRSDSA